MARTTTHTDNNDVSVDADADDGVDGLSLDVLQGRTSKNRNGGDEREQKQWSPASSVQWRQDDIAEADA